MDKNNKIYLIIIVVCALLVMGLCAYAIINHKDVKVTDAIKFKEEYESYNGMVNEYTDKNYLEVNIDRENPIVYKTGKEILDVLKEEDAFVYFGFALCPWCRNAVTPLLDAAKEMNLKTIYYVDIYDIRDTYKFTGSIEPEQTKKGTDAYYAILKFLGKNLEKYYVKDDSGNMYDTGVTRLYAPSFVAVKNGKVLDFHTGTVESQADPSVELDDKQKEELTNTFKDMIEKLQKKENVCKNEEGC